MTRYTGVRTRLQKAGLASLLAVVPAGSALAFNFDYGTISGSFDTDLTYGIQMRTQDADTNKVSSSYGNRVLFPDAGDIFGHSIRASHTLEVKYRDLGGVLVRGNYFYDNAFEGELLPRSAETRLRTSGLLTDAFLYTTLGPVNLRLGKQVISWGENTFIAGAINDINTVDVTKLRQPGSELKDAFIGTWAAYATVTFLENWTAEAFSLFDFDQVRVDPMGSMFSTLDAIGQGGGYDLGGNGQPGFGCRAHDFPNTSYGTPTPLGGCGVGPLTRVADREPSGTGQWGFALRRFFPNFGNGGEVAVYVQNLHDHLPMLSSFTRTGTFFVDYPEDIKRYGVSFNTNMAGLAMGGEYSFRQDAPVQLTAPLLPAGLPTAPPIFGATGSYQRGWAEIDRHQVQMTIQKNFGVVHLLNADAAGSILEAAFGWIDGLPPAATLLEPQVSNSFWGFQIRNSITYQAALFNLVALSPTLAYRYDVNGYSNELGGAKQFVEDRQSVSVGLDFDYQAGRYKGSISYTSFFGKDDAANVAGGILNGTTDRDFVQLSFGVSF